MSSMLCRPKFCQTSTRHCLQQLVLTWNAHVCTLTLRPFRKLPVQWNHPQNRAHSSQPTTAPTAPERGSPTRRRVDRTSAKASPQTPLASKEDLAIKVMHSHKDAIRRLKTRHLPSPSGSPRQSTGPRKQEVKSSPSSSERRNRGERGGDWRAVNRVDTKTLYPTHSREYSLTERIETLDTLSLKTLFPRQQGTFFHVSGSVFTIKSNRRVFTEPEPVRIPPFVRTAIEDYEQQYDVYNQALQQYERQAQSTIAESRPASGSGAGAVSNNAAAPPTLPTAPSPALDASSSYSSISEPKPPSIPFTVQQFLHKPLRHAPQTRESTHAPYRVSVVASKKSISKLAVYRTLCRRKFYQAIENVFRGRAQQGFDYLILAGADSLHTPQSRLEQLLIDALEDPRLHGGSGRGRGMARRSMASSSSSSSSSSSLPAQKKKSEEASGNEAEKKQRHIESDIIDKPFVAQMKRVGGVAASAVAAVHASHHKPREDARADVNQQPEGGGGEEEQDQGGRSSSSSSPSSSPSSPKLRYRDDKKPPFKRFWKHGLPDPLPRKVFREDYLNLYAVGNWGKDDPDSPEHRRAVALRQRQGMWLHRRRLVNRENQRKAVEVAKEREKVLTQHRGVVRSLIEKHFADRS